MMTKISQLGNDIFEVVVVGDTTTCHEVIVTDKVLLELTNNLVSKKDLFDFNNNLDNEIIESTTSIGNSADSHTFTPNIKQIEFC